MADTLEKRQQAEARGKTNGRDGGQHGAQNGAVATQEAKEPVPSGQHERNPGMPLDLDWVYGTRINRSAVERRAATMATRRTVKKEWQAAWLLRAITCMDLTT